MSRQIRITIDDDEVFERLKRRKDALDVSWEEALRRGLRDSPDPPRGPTGESADRHRESTAARERGPLGRPDFVSSRRGDRDGPPPVDSDLGQRIAQVVASSVQGAVPGVPEGALDVEIDRLEDAEDAVLLLGERESQHVPLRVALHTGPDGLDVEVVAVRRGKDTDGLNRFEDGARADVAQQFARGDTVPLELDGGEEVYEVRPVLTWERGPDCSPTVTDVEIRDVVFEE